MGTIELIGMEFKAYHGCLEEERRDGNVFVVDLLGRADLDLAAESDRLEDTVDYSAIYGLVAEEMARPSNLLENVAGRIVEAVAGSFPGLVELKVSVSKKNPPVGGRCHWSKVTLERRRCDDRLSDD